MAQIRPWLLPALLLGCGTTHRDLTPHPLGIVINEVVADNDGVAVDEVGEADDLVEILNPGAAPVDLADYMIQDSTSVLVPLPDLTLDPGELTVLWADQDPDQGPLHLPFKIDAEGDRLRLVTPDGRHPYDLATPELATNLALQRIPDGSDELATCRYATPGRLNGTSCGPPPPPELPEDLTFRDYTWDLPYPPVAGPLVITELALRPATFVEVSNLSDQAVRLDEYEIRIAPTAPGTEWPGPSDGLAVRFAAAAEIGPGDRAAVEVTATDTAVLEADPQFEGVVSLFRAGLSDPTDRVDFMSWPEDAVLTRQPDDRGRHVFCRVATRGAPNDACDLLPSRALSNRDRHLRTPGDFAALAEGSEQLGMASVKFLVDLQHGDAIHLLSSRTWSLHYSFVREVINGESHLDRCIPAERTVFNDGWYQFSETEYFDPNGRRYLQGTLVHHGGADLHTVEFALGDAIRSDHMQRAFFDVMGHVLDPTPWALRPQDASQADRAIAIDGNLPIVGPNAPFIGVTYQPLTEGTAYGVLRFVPASELDQTALGFDSIVITDDVPNDIPLVGGLITEAFQTPLAHVNVLSQSRGTPNMALVEARSDSRLAGYLDQLVRLEVGSEGFTVATADPTEARAFWDARLPSGPPFAPRVDLTVRALQPLEGCDYSLMPAIGTKAAQFAELYRVLPGVRYGCSGTLPFVVPQHAFAIPVVHFVEHFEASGAQALLDTLRADPDFVADPLVRAEGLGRVRDRILVHPVQPALLAEVEAAIEERFGTSRVRLRSSSNTEDLPSFNGAGLYTSVAVGVGDPDRPIADGLRTVWASLYNARAYDEREYARIDPSTVAMGVLVHEAFPSERANGVAISRNILDPIRSDIYYLNAQVGEAAVTNPAPGVVTEQLIYRWPPREPPTTHQSRSSLTGGADVLTLEEVEQISCGLYAVDRHFRPLIDPESADPWFAMEVEWKLVGPERRILFKQARPHAFGGMEPIGDCREL